MKTFSVAGTSLLNGQTTLRFAASMAREAVLKANGHTDIKLYVLPNPMNKADATLWLAEAMHVTVAHTSPVASATTTDTLEAPRNTDTAYKPFVPYNAGSAYNPGLAATEHINAWFVKAADKVFDGPQHTVAPEQHWVVNQTPESKALDYAAKRAAIKRAQRAAAKAEKIAA